MQMKAWNKARECAKQVIAGQCSCDKNRLYNIAYWGKQMRGHMDFIKAEELEALVLPDVAKLVAMADAVLVAECEG